MLIDLQKLPFLLTVFSIIAEKTDHMFPTLYFKKLRSKNPTSVASIAGLFECSQCRRLFYPTERLARLAYIQDYPLSEKISKAPWFRVLNSALEKESQLSGGHFCLQYTRSFWDIFNNEYKNSIY